MTIWWSDNDVETLKALHAEGMSFALIAKRVERSRSAVAGAVRRYIKRVPDLRKKHKRRVTTGQATAKCWDESMLTEPYAMRKARRTQ